MNPVLQLGDIASVVMGQAPPGKDCNKEGNGHPFVKAGEFSADRPVIREWTTNPLKKAKEGDVLVCVVGATAGKVNLGIDCAIGRSVAAVRPLPQRLDTNYLHHFLKTKTLTLRHGSQGLAQGVITREMLLGLEIPLPPLEEQRRIAAILDKADKLNNLARMSTNEQAALKESVFLDTFGNPSHCSSSWPVKALGEVARLENGDRSSNYPSGDDIKDEGIPFLSTKNIVNNKLDLSKASYISVDKFNSLTQGKARTGDLVITLRGTLGSCCIFSCSHETAFINAQMMLIRPGDLLSSLYLHSLLTSSSFQAKLQSLGYGAAVRQLSSGQLSELAIPVPPVSLQEQFSYQLSRALKVSSACEVRHEATKRLVRSLQLQAFSGEGLT
jgi:type I restriction enzyme S subunit